MLPCEGRSPNAPRKATLVRPNKILTNPERTSNRFADELTPAERAQGIRGIATLNVTTLRRDNSATTEESANIERPRTDGSLA